MSEQHQIPDVLEQEFASLNAKKPKRYCGPCDKWVPANQTVCKACGADTDKAAK